jgi:hypothetical protein
LGATAKAALILNLIRGELGADFTDLGKIVGLVPFFFVYFAQPLQLLLFLI